MRPGRAGAAGMTLIEVMMAISIAVGIVTFIYVAARDVGKVKANLEGDADRLREAQMALDRLGRDLRSAHLSGHKKPLGPKVDSQFIGKNDDPVDSLILVAFTHRHRVFDAKDSDRAEVEYLAVEDPENSRVVHLGRREAPVVDDKLDRGGRTVILVHDILDFRLEYYDVERDEWEEEWDTSQATGQPNRLPLQVRAQVVLADRHGGEIALGTQIPLQMLQPILIPGGFQ